MCRWNLFVGGVALLAAGSQYDACLAQDAVSVNFRNVLLQGGFTAQFEQLDAQGVVVGLTPLRIENGAVGTITVSPAARFNIRVLPDGGGGHVYSNRDLAADFRNNAGRPIELDGRFDPVTGERIAIVMRIGATEIVAPRMEYGAADGHSYQNLGCCTPSNYYRVRRHRLFRRRCW